MRTAAHFMTALSILLLQIAGFSTHCIAQEKSKAHEGQEHEFTNELAKESSPYLLMHAHNPVNWYAWSEATLAKAKKEDKPIFLSIGYSSCHWCHVMERESFYDKEIAKFLNENFICIKVDREERPDVDEIYMQALMEIRNGGGGWPLSMFMTPDAKPFFGGTYWPARDGDRGSKMGFLTIVNKVNEHYTNNREKIEKDASVVTERTREALAGLTPQKGLPVQKSWSGKTVANLASDFDSRFGGFGYSARDSQRPKFPQPANLFFLFDKVQRATNQNDPDVVTAKTMLIKTCERMMMGGIYDHLGGGFHRYSVDRYWKIPHFEKMLYDNGQLATVYAEVYKMTSREEFKNVVDGIISFVDRELVAEGGGFYSSLDAESEGEEGKFYRWELEEIKKTLSPQQYELFASVYGLNLPPNFEEDYYAPQLNKQMAEIAKSKSMTLGELEKQLTPIRQALFDVRAKRIRPLLDHKILTAWNGLMIRGYADAGRVLKNEDYIRSSEKAATFVLENLRNPETNRLFRTYTGNKPQLNGYLIDYACLIDGLIALHRATGKEKWLNEAKTLQKVQDDLFWDEKSGGYFYTSKDHEVLLARSKRIYDNAMPSGNSVSAANLFYLGKELKDKDLTEKSHKTVMAASTVMTRAPHAAPRMMIAAEEFVK